MSKEKLIFCPLGGSGEIGGNMNLYAYGEDDNQKWIIVDMGVSFADDSVPGVDLIMPDAGFIICLLYTSPSPRDRTRSRMPSSA